MEHEILQVETVSLNDLLLSQAAPPRIDYISIDTEGSELAILEAFDFARWDVRLFTIEHNLTMRRNRSIASCTSTATKSGLPTTR